MEDGQPIRAIPVPQEDVKDFLKAFVDLGIESERVDLYMKLRGYVKRYKLNEMKTKLNTVIEHDPNLELCNEEGAIHITSLIDDYFNPSILMANYTEEEAVERLKMKSEEVRVAIVTNKTKFGIKESNWMRIWNLVMSKADIAFHIAIKGQFMKFLKTTHQIRHLEHQTMTQQQPKKPGFWSNIAQNIGGKI